MNTRVSVWLRDLLRVDFVRFCLVGALGFILNFMFLTLLYRSLGVPLFLAQLLAGEFALFSNFYLHHTWTYRDTQTRKSIKLLLIQFHLTSWSAILATAVIVTFSVKALHMHYFAALVIAGASALLWNFAWAKYVIWAKSAATEPAQASEIQQ